MKIYTKTGDTGTTSLFGGKRVSKADLRIETYGTVDELNSWIGLMRDQEVNKIRSDIFINIQNHLFVIGSMLAAEPGNNRIKIPKISPTDVTFLENEIDRMQDQLPPMRFFVLPGGHQSVSFAHVARTVCRRAERMVIALDTAEKVDALIVVYLNRLSDFLFVVSRLIAQELGAEEVPWKPEI